MSDRLAFTIRQFCEAHGISPSTYYEQKKLGRGPREMRIGLTGVRISQEAAAEWRRKSEELAVVAPETEVTA